MNTESLNEQIVDLEIKASAQKKEYKEAKSHLKKLRDAYKKTMSKLDRLNKAWDTEEF